VAAVSWLLAAVASPAGCCAALQAVVAASPYEWMEAIAPCEKASYKCRVLSNWLTAHLRCVCCTSSIILAVWPQL
jgi:hypothetical protein